MKILISPAKSISMDSISIEHNTSTAHFLEQSEYLVKKLKKYSVKKLIDLYKVSEDIARLNHDRFANWESPTEEKESFKAAAYAFTGEVYRGLEINELDKNEVEYLQENLRILSGLYGMLKPLDRIYPYRLEMGTKIQITPKQKGLYKFWGDKLTDFLNQEESELVLNLASNEYFKAINTKKLKAQLITAQFKEFKNGQYKVLMTYAKHARGEMAKYCAKNKITDKEQLKLFDYEGYQFMPNLSTEEEFVFAR